MNKEILLNIESKEVRAAYLHHGKLQNLFIERKRERQLSGNIYKGRVTNLLSNIQSAFIDINEGENGFIHISDVIENSKKLKEMFDMDFDSGESETEGEETESDEEKDIAEVLKPDQWVLVQVVKEPIGSKGARLTANISLPGRYLVLLPNSSHRGISRKIEDRALRERLRRLVRGFDLPSNIGFICRTACRHASDEAIVEEAQELLDQWHELIHNFQESDSSICLYQENDLIKRSVLKAIDSRYDRILIDDYHTYQVCKQIYDKYSAEHLVRLEFYRDKIPMFERFNVEREIDRSLKRKIWLNSGGYLYFDRTEAMYTIDVNSGRSTNSSEGNLEETLVRINLEAAEEIARQLRIRNIGGLVICDFIDMRARKNQKRVLEKLKECMKDDKAKCSILSMSEFGLVEMTRQRSRESLAQTIFQECPYCNGMGMIKNHETVTIEIERGLKKAIRVKQQYALELITHPELSSYMQQIDRDYLASLAEELNARLSFSTNDNLHLNDYYFINSLNQEKIEV